MDKWQRFNNLLEKGYFPEELPPPFETILLAKNSKLLVNLWKATGITAKKLNALKSSKYEVYNYPKIEPTRRNLALINPSNYFFLSKLIADNWATLQKHFETSKISISKCEFTKTYSRAILNPNFEERTLKKLSINSQFDNILVSDISRFYGTLYTHTIPWALKGKAFCKKSLNTSNFRNSFGNKLDIAVRKGQENQTIGIPVGPDTSRIISEVVATGIDKELQSSLNLTGKKAFRFIDDWFIGFDGAGEGEKAYSKLAATCKHFELELNSEKTKNISAKESLEHTWILDLRTFTFPLALKAQRIAIDNFFIKAFDLFKKNPNDNVLLYAVKKSRSLKCAKENWDLYENYLLKSARANKRAVPFCAEIFINYNYLGFKLDKKKISKLINDLIHNNSPIEAHGEISWMLFLAKGLKIKINALPAKKLSRVHSSVCALIALDLFNNGLIPKGLNITYWNSFLTPKGLYSDLWLLAYEAAFQGWLKGSPNDFIEKDPYFKHLKANNINFYNPKRNVPKLTKPRTPKILKVFLKRKKPQIFGYSFFDFY